MEPCVQHLPAAGLKFWSLIQFSRVCNYLRSWSPAIRPFSAEISNYDHRFGSWTDPEQMVYLWYINCIYIYIYVSISFYVNLDFTSLTESENHIWSKSFARLIKHMLGQHGDAGESFTFYGHWVAYAWEYLSRTSEGLYIARVGLMFILFHWWASCWPVC